MKRKLFLVAAIVLLASISVYAMFFSPTNYTITPMDNTIYDFTVKNIDGQEVKLDTYRGKVLLIVNVASQCGYTPQYEGLEKIYKQYKDKGFFVLGFPANNFGNQEPGTEKEIKEFCTLNFGVTFPMFSKVSVKGADQAPLFKYLVASTGGADIRWNFGKFLVGKDGKVIARFDSGDKPESEKVTKAIEAALAK